jgi:hypothetical protein
MEKEYILVVTQNDFTAYLYEKYSEDLSDFNYSATSEGYMTDTTEGGTQSEQTVKPSSRLFPPRRDYASLSVRDLLEAREAYHAHLSSLENVIATAIGRYRIHNKDWYADNPPDRPRPSTFERVVEPRTLQNSVVRSWSWPAVMVFVQKWDTPDNLGDQVVPRTLYLPDGRVVPTCVIQARLDQSPPPPVYGPSQVSPLLGGGYSCLREHQGEIHLGTIGCLIQKDGSYYALTNRHVAGRGGEVIKAYVHGEYHQIGICADIGLTKHPMSVVFPTWTNQKEYARLDAGLILIDNIDDWTSQAYGIGELGEVFNATEQSVMLDLIGCPVRAFGGTSGVMEGEIQALFYRYSSLSGYEDTTDVLIGPRTGEARETTLAPFTRPGDSGSLWFYDPPSRGKKETVEDVPGHLPPDHGLRARRLCPIVMQWGASRFMDEAGLSSAFALGSFISSICRGLDVELVHDWSTGHEEYWGKLAHFAIGWKACERLSGSLSALMMKNQTRIGFGDQKLKEGSKFSMGRGNFVPLADVPDYVLVRTRPNESIQHFADIDIADINGGPSLLTCCHQDPRNVSAKVWKKYFDGFAAAKVGPDPGALPFRIWQIWEAMVGYLKARDVIHFVAAAGILPHYVGDASQRLHCSYMHHGIPPLKTHEGRKYPAPRKSDAFKAFQKSREYKIHSIYDELMVEVDTPALLNDVNMLLPNAGAPNGSIKTGYEAAVAALEMMYKAQQSLSAKKIIDADQPQQKLGDRAKALWNNEEIRRATINSIVESVQLLANLWTSAWKVGDGDSIDPSLLLQFSEDDLEKIYREEEDFIPSLSLQAMQKSGLYEPR